MNRLLVYLYNGPEIGDANVDYKLCKNYAGELSVKSEIIVFPWGASKTFYSGVNFIVKSTVE